MIFKKKKKAYFDFHVLTAANKNTFEVELKDSIDSYQRAGFEVEVQYSLNGAFSALVLAYEVK